MPASCYFALVFWWPVEKVLKRRCAICGDLVGILESLSHGISSLHWAVSIHRLWFHAISPFSLFHLSPNGWWRVGDSHRAFLSGLLFVARRAAVTTALWEGRCRGCNISLQILRGVPWASYWPQAMSDSQWQGCEGQLNPLAREGNPGSGREYFPRAVYAGEGPSAGT